MKPTMLIVDDHPMLLAGLREALADNYRIEYASSFQIAEMMLLSDAFDIVLFDFFLGQTTSVGLLRVVRDNHPNTRICMITQEITEVMVEQVAPFLPDAIMDKSLQPTKLLELVQDVCAGGRYYDAQVVTNLFRLVSGQSRDGQAGPEVSDFTIEERGVLKLTAEGFTAKEIADQLDISVATVNLLRRDIKNRLGLTSLADLIAYVHTHERELSLQA